MKPTCVKDCRLGDIARLAAGYMCNGQNPRYFKLILSKTCKKETKQSWNNKMSVSAPPDSSV